MALVTRIYFNAVFGALGGLLGWLLYGIMGRPIAERFWLLSLLGGALIGGFIGYFVVSVEAIRDRSLVRFVRLASYGLLLAGVGGILGMTLAEGINHVLNWLFGYPSSWIAKVFRGILRGPAWMFLGLAVGTSEGIAARSLGKFSYGTLGGAIGGFIGGMVVGVAVELTRDLPGLRPIGTALGLMILGACIGSLSALVQGVFQPASVKVLRGWQEGREYPLDKPRSLLGRDEHADIALFRDMRVEKQHAFIERVDQRFVLVNNGAPPDYTRINDRPVSDRADLNDGDRLQLGNVILRFQRRAAQNQPKRGLPPVRLPSSGTGDPRAGRPDAIKPGPSRDLYADPRSR